MNNTTTSSNGGLVNRLTNRFSSALTDCNTTLQDTRRVSYVIIVLLVVLIIIYVLGWSNFWVYVVIALMAVASIFLALLVTRNRCFQPSTNLI